VAGTPLYLEDLHIGQRFSSSGTYRMDEEKMKAFAAEYDPQPFHLDDEAAKSTVFQGLAATGWYTAAVAMRLFVDSDLRIANGLVGLGGEISWPRPTRPGDILRLEGEILDIRRSRSKPNQGIVTVRSTILNQYDQVAQVFTAKIVVYARPM
jgi:acyl dehydratase